MWGAGYWIFLCFGWIFEGLGIWVGVGACLIGEVEWWVGVYVGGVVYLLKCWMGLGAGLGVCGSSGVGVGWGREHWVYFRFYLRFVVELWGLLWCFIGLYL